ncbi:MAG: hypothetical protein RBT80_22595 [Candidatus Vecturithrix sp.]|nr:hypothetical protein [Candidatus Vecturithrix sp.]
MEFQRALQRPSALRLAIDRQEKEPVENFGLTEAARDLRVTTIDGSKWAKIAQEAHKESPLEGLNAHILRCSQEIRDHSEFKHDQEVV